MTAPARTARAGPLRRKAPPAIHQQNGAHSSTISSPRNYNGSAAPATPRGSATDEAPFCWQNKRVLRLITETFAESNQAASARSVYLAMTEIASDLQAETFIAGIADIARRAGVSYKTVDRLLGGLVALGVIAVRRRATAAGSGRIKAPSEYTLLSIGLSNSSSIRLSDLSSIGHGGKHTSMTDILEESGRILEESVEEPRAASAAASAARFILPDGLVLSSDERSVIEFYNQTLPPLGWLPVTRVTDELRKALSAALSAAEWHELIAEMADAPRHEWPTSRTLVRLRWDTY